MRRSLWLGAATWWLLQLGACGDQPPAKAPHSHALHSRTAQATSPDDGDSDPEPIETGEKPPESPGGAPSTSPQRAPFATSEQMAERFGKTRALAVQRGSASYYSDAFAGRKTASGALYEPDIFMAAHRTLPFGTVLRVTRQDGGRSVYVQVTDRGPFGPRGRILDLSHAAADQLGMLRAGVVKVKLEVVEYGPRTAPRHKRSR